MASSEDDQRRDIENYLLTQEEIITVRKHLFIVPRF